MKKKIISALLCVTMVATMAVGCGASGDEKKDDANKQKTEQAKDDKEEVASDTVFGKHLHRLMKIWHRFRKKIQERSWQLSKVHCLTPSGLRCRKVMRMQQRNMV